MVSNILPLNIISMHFSLNILRIIFVGLQEKDVLLVPFNLTETAKHEEAHKKIMGQFKQVIR